MKILTWLKDFFLPEVKNTVVEAFESAATATKLKRKRARNKKGEFVADDPSTEKNEAYED